MANLEEIFIRAQAKDGKWGNLSLAEVDRRTFDSWARTELGVVCKDFSRAPQWTPEERSAFVDQLRGRGVAGSPWGAHVTQR